MFACAFRLLLVHSANAWSDEQVQRKLFRREDVPQAKNITVSFAPSGSLQQIAAAEESLVAHTGEADDLVVEDLVAGQNGEYLSFGVNNWEAFFGQNMPAENSFKAAVNGRTGTMTVWKENLDCKVDGVPALCGQFADDSSSEIQLQKGDIIRKVRVSRAPTKDAATASRCYDFTKPNGVYGQYLFKLSEPGMPCTGPGNWRLLRFAVSMNSICF